MVGAGVVKLALPSRPSLLAGSVVLCGFVGLLAARVFATPAAALLSLIVMVVVPGLVIDRLPGEVRAVVHVVSLIVGLGVVAAVAAGSVPQDVINGVIGGAGDIGSVSWPAPIEPSLYVFVALLIGVAALTAAELVISGRWRAMVLLPSVILGVGLTAIAAPAGRPSFGWLIGWLVSSAVVLWGAVDRAEAQQRRSRRANGLVAVAMLAPIVAAGWVAHEVVPSWSARDRLDPRVGRAVTTDELLGRASLAGVAAERETDPPEPRYEISGSTGVRWRLFGLDQFDGIDWGIGPSFRRVGRRLNGSPLDSATDRSQFVTITPLNQPLTWLPINGVPTGLERQASADADRSMLLVEPAAAIGERVSVTVDSLVDEQPLIMAAERTRARVGGPLDDTAAGFRALADGMLVTAALSGSSVEPVDELFGALRAIEHSLVTDYRINPDSPVSSSVGALKAVLESSRQGAEEQYVASFVLLARSLGARSRVAVGYRTTTAPGLLTSADAHTWPEIWFDGVGWVPFDPVPTATVENRPTPSSPTGNEPPAVLPDPSALVGDKAATPRPGTETAATSARHRTIHWRWMMLAGAMLVAAASGLTLVATLMAKRRRRRRRMTALDPADRVIGVWAEATDALVDYGATFQPNQSNDEIARAVGSFVDAQGADAAIGLAELANAAAHAREVPDDLVVALATRLGAQVDESLRRGHRRLERGRAQITLRSFRRDTRSPVR